MKKPLLIIDADCGFWEKTAGLVQTWTKNKLEIKGWQALIDDLPSYGLTPEDGMLQVWFVAADGSVTGGAEAANLALRYCWWAYPITFLYYVPGVRQLQDRAYRWVADNRYKMPGSTPACEIPVKQETMNDK